MKFAKHFRKLARKPSPQKVFEQPAASPIVRLVSISMVKNEQDVIEPFLRHNRPFLDAMIVLDNGSSDRTAEIVADCARELGGIFFAHLPGFGYTQSEFMTSALHHVQSAFFADFICFLDADEFIGAPDRQAFEKALDRVPVGQSTRHAWQTFLPSPAMPLSQHADFLDYMTHRRIHEQPQYFKSFIRLNGGTEPELVVEQGNHRFSRAGRPVAQHDIADVPLRHMPVRSASQVLMKGAVSWAANLARPNGSAKDGAALQWKRLFDLAVQGRMSLPNAQLCDEAMAYAQDHPAVHFADNAIEAHHHIDSKRRYSDGRPAEPYRTIALSLMRANSPAVTIKGPATQPHAPGASDIPNAFDAAWHWQNMFLDVAPFRYIAQKLRPDSVLDVGCGTGHYLRLFQDEGATCVQGVDGIDLSATALDADSYTKADLQQPYDAGRKFDLVVCLEVAEHLEPATMDILFDTVEKHATNVVIFSMAEPGQPGNGHINCQKIEDVLTLWKRRGWVPDLIETLGLRSISTMSWFRRNILVLKPARDPVDDQAADALVRIGALDYRWYGQMPGIRHAAFQEKFPDPTVAYGRVFPPPPLAPSPAPA